MQNGNKIYIAYKKNNEHFINHCFYLQYFKCLTMSTLLYLRHLCSKKQTNVMGGLGRGSPEKCREKPAANREQGSKI